MHRALVIVLLTGLSACSRSQSLDSDRLDCGEGVRVFSRNAAHCAYLLEEAPGPDECPMDVSHRYATHDIVLCSSSDSLTSEWIVAIVDQAWPPDTGVADAGTVIADGNTPDTAITNAAAETDAEPVSMSSTD